MMEEKLKEKIKAVKKGDQQAYEYIVEIFQNKVFGICFRMIGNRHEAEDMAQEAFIRAYINISRFNTDLKFSTWLYRIATNLCIDRLRKKKPDYYLDAEVTGTDGLTMYSQVATDTDLPEDNLVSMELAETIERAILRLPEKYRTVIVLKYIEELSLKEISEILDIPVGTVKTRIHRGREALRQQLSNV